MPIDCGLVGLLLLMQATSQPLCGPGSPPNGLCQPGGTPGGNTDTLIAPTVGQGLGPHSYPVEVLLEDGGAPIGRPSISYLSCPGVPAAEDQPVSNTCVALITLKGFTGVRWPVTANKKTTVVLSRIGMEADSSSANRVGLHQLSIPPKAHTSYALGEPAAGLEHWNEAEKYFRQAVASAPSFALAWDELGWALERQNKKTDAAEAYRQAIAADPKLTRPYIHLAGLAIASLQWDEAIRLTDAAIALRPTHYPRAYFYNTMAHFSLHQMKAAEASARKTIAEDPIHAFPLAEYVLGVSLLERNDPAAAEHLNLFLELQPQSPIAVSVREAITRKKQSEAALK